MKINWNFLRGGGTNQKKPSVGGRGGLWIFSVSGTTQLQVAVHFILHQLRWKAEAFINRLEIAGTSDFSFFFLLLQYTNNNDPFIKNYQNNRQE